MSNMTKVLGYYNGTRWNIQLVISRFNITLTLKPGEFLLDRQGRKINDPYFEVYANQRQLQRELSATEVPIIAVPVVTGAAPAVRPANPVRSVTEWTRDSKGIRQPVLTETAPAAASTEAAGAPMVSSTSSSVTPMTMEQARRSGLIRKVREVPDDYGVSDSTGLPPSRIPPMRYAIDPTVGKPQPGLPKELLQMPKDDASVPDRAAIVAGLNRSSQAAPPETGSTNPFANSGTPLIPDSSPVIAGKPAPITESAPLPESAGEEDSLPQPVLDDPIPAVSDPAAEADALVETEAAEAVAEATPVQPPVQHAPPIQVAPKAEPAPQNYICIACGESFKFRSLLNSHAYAKHKKQARGIMAQYPGGQVMAPAAAQQA